MKLFVLPGACSLASHISLEASGGDFEIHVVQRGSNRQAGYLDINPRGTVPALIDRGGRLVVESMAVLLHIADAHPQAQLAPRIGESNRDRMHQLLSFMVTTAHPGFQMLWRSERFADTEDGQAAVRRSAEARLDGILSELDRELGDKPALLGEGFSVADAYLFVISRWGLRLTKPTTAYDRLWKFTRTVSEMGATRRALAREGISLIGPSSGLG